MKKILLLNPPAPRLCVRDYYCGFSSKAEYCWPPQDLVVLSGILSGDLQVCYLDPCSAGYDRRRSLEYILAGDCDAVIFTSGSLHLTEDIAFVKEIKDNRARAKIIGSSAVFRFIGADIMREHPFIDGLLRDFTNNDAVLFLSGEYENIADMFFRDRNRALRSNWKEREY
ncbi:MAG: hypothetical protein WBE75_06180 [Candidatus Omnitrophota bacterium]|jgi:hypothetical protein